MISDNVLAMCELENDLLYRRIPEEKYRYYTEESLLAGRQAARRMKQQLGAVDMRQIYRESGIEILYEENGKSHYGISFRAQSEYGLDGSAKVFIYRNSIALLAKKSQSALPESLESYPVDMDMALQMHLAHEYFHYLEYHSSEMKDKAIMEMYDLGYVSDHLESVALVSLFGRKRTGSIQRCSEIAAHAFAKELLDLPVLPNYYDYVYLIHEKKMSAEDFCAMLKENSRFFEN